MTSRGGERDQTTEAVPHDRRRPPVDHGDQIGHQRVDRR
jgi:hypothetical protein